MLKYMCTNKISKIGLILAAKLLLKCLKNSKITLIFLLLEFYNSAKAKETSTSNKFEKSKFKIFKIFAFFYLNSNQANPNAAEGKEQRREKESHSECDSRFGTEAYTYT